MREMDSHDEQTHYVKRVVLPSGKTIEVVYFKDDDAQIPARIEPQAPSTPRPSRSRNCTCASSAPRSSSIP